MPKSRAPEFELTESIYEVLNEKTRGRAGLVYKNRYDSGRIVYWVHDLDDTKRGYILANNQAYKFSWHSGQRSSEAEFIGTDRMSFNVRRILDYNKPVVLVEINAQTLAEQRLPNRYDQPKPAAPAEQE